MRFAPTGLAVLTVVCYAQPSGAQEATTSEQVTTGGGAQPKTGERAARSGSVELDGIARRTFGLGGFAATIDGAASRNRFGFGVLQFGLGSVHSRWFSGRHRDELYLGTGSGGLDYRASLFSSVGPRWPLAERHAPVLRLGFDLETADLADDFGSRVRFPHGELGYHYTDEITHIEAVVAYAYQWLGRLKPEGRRFELDGAWGPGAHLGLTHRWLTLIADYRSVLGFGSADRDYHQVEGQVCWSSSSTAVCVDSQLWRVTSSAATTIQVPGREGASYSRLGLSVTVGDIHSTVRRANKRK